MQIYVEDMNQADLQLFGTCSQPARRCPNLLAQLPAPAAVLSSARAVAPGSARCCQRWHGELGGVQHADTWLCLHPEMRRRLPPELFPSTLPYGSGLTRGGLHGPQLVCSSCQVISCLLVNAIPIDHFPAGLYWFSLIQCKCFACRKGSMNVPMRSKSVPLFSLAL